MNEIENETAGDHDSCLALKATIVNSVVVYYVIWFISVENEKRKNEPSRLGNYGNNTPEKESRRENKMKITGPFVLWRKRKTPSTSETELHDIDSFVLALKIV